jgi:phage tail-like protein
MYDTEGKAVLTWDFANAYPVKWTGSDLNAGATEFLTESLEIAHSGMAVK